VEVYIVSNFLLLLVYVDGGESVASSVNQGRKAARPEPQHPVTSQYPSQNQSSLGHWQSFKNQSSSTQVQSTPAQNKLPHSRGGGHSTQAQGRLSTAQGQSYLPQSQTSLAQYRPSEGQGQANVSQGHLSRVGRHVSPAQGDSSWYSGQDRESSADKRGVSEKKEKGLLKSIGGMLGYDVLFIVYKKYINLILSRVKGFKYSVKTQFQITSLLHILIKNIF